MDFGIVGDIAGGISDLLTGGSVNTPAGATYDWKAADEAAKQQGQVREQQNALAGMLQQQAQGQGPSVAQQQLRQAQAANAAQQSSQAVSAQGGALNRMLAQKNAADQAGAAGNQIAAKGAELRAGEMLSARGQLGDTLGNIRSGDQNMQAMQQNRQLGIGSGQISSQGQLLERDLANRKARGGLVGGLGSAAMMGMALFSDERVKHDIVPTNDNALERTLEHMTPKQFRYNDEGSEQPPRAGIIAQELEEDPYGQNIVRRDEMGTRMIDGPSAISLLLASVGHLNRRIDELDKKGGR